MYTFLPTHRLRVESLIAESVQAQGLRAIVTPVGAGVRTETRPAGLGAGGRRGRSKGFRSNSLHHPTGKERDIATRHFHVACIPALVNSDVDVTTCANLREGRPATVVTERNIDTVR
ncbi:hypothetical protein EVAR_3974_1 [Eumeta japonica]|uniref:Uncharacterized protein n=1 Tax=Eumeta variegata TaxID=151549 RepID=A0A4C1SR84_EUMVA|nr:hypothetical protein EVAR_3974_1 [Eumeta japonica]